MSERKEFIFKEDSNNKFPSPNTPSSLNGGLEGKRNLSTKENKSVIMGLSSSRLKKQSLKKKEAPQPTERDLILLEYLNDYGVLSSQQIRKLVFNGTNIRTVLRRLRLLKQRGWIFSSEGLPNGGLTWLLSKKSALLFKHSVETKLINKNTLQRDVIVSGIRIQLESLEIAKSWTPEHILKKQVLKSLYEEERSFSQIEEPLFIPDGLFVTKQEEEVKAVALELELSLKSKARYKKIFSQYKKKRKLWFVWYVVLNRSVGETLSNFWDQYAFVVRL